MALTKRQQLFVNSYCENPDLGQTAAAKAAGCGKRAAITACEWMRRPEIISEIQRRMQKGAEQQVGAIERRVNYGEVSEASILEDLCILEEDVQRSGIGAWQAATRTKIIELRAKIKKLFSDAPQVNVNALILENLLEGRRRAGLVIASEVKELPAAPENIAPGLDMSVSFRPDQPVAPPETSAEGALG